MNSQTPAPTTVTQCLAEAKALGVERIDATRLAAHLLGRSRSWLLAHGDAEVCAPQLVDLRARMARLAAGEPLAYLTGEQDFHGLALQVDARVLVPRADTEVLVDWALELLRGALGHVPEPAVVDLGTGSGAIALALKHGHAAARVLATDNSQGALSVARRNAERLSLDIAFASGSWWRAVGGQRFHLVVSNPPYIAADDRHLQALRHEPLAALSPGGTGLGALAEIIAGASAHMETGGWLLMEHGFDQADAVAALLAERGFVGIETRRDLGRRARCTGAHR